MMAGKGYVRVYRSLSVAVASKMPKRTWQKNYRCISKESSESILRELRVGLRETLPPLTPVSRSRPSGHVVECWQGGFVAKPAITSTADHAEMPVHNMRKFIGL